MLMAMRHTQPELQFTHMLPYGAVIGDSGVQFVVFSRNATEMRLLLYDNVEGDIWSIYVPGLSQGQLYHFQSSGPHDPKHGLRFDSNARLIDPYAKALAGRFQSSADGIIRPPKCVVVDDHFDWAGDRHLRPPTWASLKRFLI